MQKNKIKKLLALLLSFVLVFSLTACSTNDAKETESESASAGETEGATESTEDESEETEDVDSASNSDEPLVVATNTLGGKFNPFNYQLAYDEYITRATQVTLVTLDREAGVVYNAIDGETREYNGTEYTYYGIADVEVNRDEDADTTTYTFKLREDVTFSDGEPLTADDVIFNLYVYCDPAYDGLGTMYSLPIQGLTNYQLNSSEGDSITDEDIAAAIADPSDELQEFIKVNIIEETLVNVEAAWAEENYEEYGKDSAIDLLVDSYGIDEDADYTDMSIEDVAKAIAAQYGTDYKALAEAYAADSTYFDDAVSNFVTEALVSTAGGEEVSRIEGIKRIDDYTVEVTTDGFDATAIYQFGIFIAPLHYYGEEYNYDNDQFGITRGDLSTINSKTSAPLGAGPYVFKSYENKIVYFEANENFYLGEVKTKELQYIETQAEDMISAVASGTADIANPSYSKTQVEEIQKYNSNEDIVGDVVTTASVANNGYGYLGINAANVNVGGETDSDASISLRKAFATILAVYRDEAIDSYYGETASVINYPITMTSWASPQKSDSDYQIAFSVDLDGNEIYTSDMITEDKYEAALKAALGYFEAAGYTVTDGKLTAAPEGASLEYEVMIAGGGSGDHPAFALLTSAKEALESIGMTLTINDPADQNVMWNKINANEQQLWVAAWGGSADPDMYQLYHSTSIGGSNHYNIADVELDALIVDGRTSDDQSYRKSIYKTAMDIILDWAVEVPLYQRENCFIYSTERVNVDTIAGDITPYWDYSYEIYNIEMK